MSLAKSNDLGYEVGSSGREPTSSGTRSTFSKSAVNIGEIEGRGNRDSTTKSCKFCLVSLEIKGQLWKGSSSNSVSVRVARACGFQSIGGLENSRVITSDLERLGRFTTE